MRKDKLSSFQAKKQKLLKIKEKIINYDIHWKKGIAIYTVENNMITTKYDTYEQTFNLLEEIWEIVKDE